MQKASGVRSNNIAPLETLQTDFERNFASPESRASITKAMVKGVSDLLSKEYEIDNKNSSQCQRSTLQLPTITTTRKVVLMRISDSLKKKCINHHVYICGGAAAHMVSSTHEFADVDILFNLNAFDRDSRQLFRDIRREMSLVLKSLLPEAVREKLVGESAVLIGDAYFKKMCIIPDADTPQWSLFSLFSKNCIPMDIKFCIGTVRCWQFYCDSLCIRIDDFLKTGCDPEQIQRKELVFSSSGNVLLSCNNIRNRFIATDDPYLIYGGGLLKYVSNLCKGYLPTSEMKTLIPKMILKFHHDFHYDNMINRKIKNHLLDHTTVSQQRENYLNKLIGVLVEATESKFNKISKTFGRIIENEVHNIAKELELNIAERQFESKLT